MDAAVVKVMGMTWYRGQFSQYRALKIYHPRTCLKCPSTKVDKSKRFPARAGISCSLSFKAERKIYLRSCASVPPSLSASRVGTPFVCELSNFGMPMNVSFYGLVSGLSPTYYGSSSISRSFSQIAKAGTRSHIITVEGGGTAKNGQVNTFNKRRKSPKAFVDQKRNATSKEEFTNNSCSGKVAAVEDVGVFSLNGQIVKDNETSLVGDNTQTPKGKVKLKQSRNNKKQSQSSSLSASTEASDTPNSSQKESGAEGTKISRSEQSHVSPEVQSNLTSSTLTESVQKKARKSYAKKKKSSVESSSLPKTNEKLTGQSDIKVSPTPTACLITKTMSQSGKSWPQLYPPISKSVVVVESATKAKVIQGYLGEMYEVLPSYGHVRDLAARAGSVRPDDDFSMVWEVPYPAWSHLKSIKVALSGAKNLILASDPDREGEAIAWHLIEMLQQQDALREEVTVSRVVFNEITESSIKSALQAPRNIDADLVHAYLARRALDYLIGFNVSPLLWRKLPGCQSAGRVQSAALALICDREKQIDEFKATEYWTIDANFQKSDPDSANNVAISSHLTHFDSKRLNQLSISSNVEATNIEEKINLSTFEVIASKTSKSRRNPPMPYITSTLQQDGANKLNFAASVTMKVAQKLYEGVELSDGKATGLITYMRTDGLHLSDEAAKSIQHFIVEKYGPIFATKSTRKHFKKVKNAQEAHEAIRPTDIRRLPSSLAGVLDEDSLKLYTLIWRRTMACQMEPAIIEQIQCDIGKADQSIMFRSTCSRVEFLGFQAAYEDIETINFRNHDDDDGHHNDVFEILSNLKYGQSLCLTKVALDQHYTQPPPRYSEGSLVKKLEELGIGRPSTYASTIKVLKDRNYITMKSRTLYPEFRGRMVSAFLLHYFSEVSDYSFTADMEAELDNVSAGITEWKGLLKNYWTRFSKYCESASDVHIHQVEKMLEKAFGDFLFSSLPDGNRTCPSCLAGTLVFKVSKFGAGYFIGCDQYPKCKYIAQTLYGADEDDDITLNRQKRNVEEPKVLGLHPASKEKILLKCGPYGYYVQLGEDRKGQLPKRASASQIKDIDSITLESALELLQYPVTLGNHPDDDHPVILKLARVGFTIRHRRTIAPVPKNLRPNEISLEQALVLLKGKDVRRCGRPKLKKSTV
ncbi:DNA topoisomerase [Perilla frutescens var. hirtella]|uniref:DNA topoisomerase n=1 Tax=Perilla frutescens var. hirtella TaxID=608512 RepID=A0AAD4P9L4_PERFH|nr:DNA topoisomerase [Perilla frutescens var. hirtella]